MPPKRKDFTQIAFDVVQRATGEVNTPAPSKNPESRRKVKNNPPKAQRRTTLVKR